MAAEQAHLRSLQAEGFELAELSEPRVDTKSRVRVRNNFYSVPASLVGRKVAVRLLPASVEASWEGKVVARHDRLHWKFAESLHLDHYLDVQVDKPGAFPGSLPLHQARQRGDFPASYDELWGKLKARLGDRPGTRAMIEVLLLLYKPNYTWPGLIIVLLGLPVYFIWRRKAKYEPVCNEVP